MLRCLPKVLLLSKLSLTNSAWSDWGLDDSGPAGEERRRIMVEKSLRKSSNNNHTATLVSCSKDAEQKTLLSKFGNSYC
jgi:hypothetical protein